MVVDVDFACESIGETLDLDLAGGAVFFVAGQLVGEPEHARPEAGCPAGVATWRITLAGPTNGINTVLGGVVGVDVGEGVEVAVDGGQSGFEGGGYLVKDHSFHAPRSA